MVTKKPAKARKPKLGPDVVEMLTKGKPTFMMFMDGAKKTARFFCCPAVQRRSRKVLLIEKGREQAREFKSPEAASKNAAAFLKRACKEYGLVRP